MPASELVGLGDRLHHDPSQRSGGQRQRVAITRALDNEPTLRLAEERTGSLNTEHGNTVLDIFQELHQHGMSITLVTHDRHNADLARPTIDLMDGRATRDDTIGTTPAQPETDS